MRTLAAAALVIALAGCHTVAPPKPAQALRGERDAAEIARGIVGGRIGALFYMDRMRSSSLARLPEIYYFVKPLFKIGSIDPKVDLDRLFISVDQAQSHDMVLILQHTMSRARVATFFEELQKRAFPAGRADINFPAADTFIDGHYRFVAEPQPGLIVVLPSDRATEAVKFASTGGFPDPEGDECGQFVAVEPATSLYSSLAPPFPSALDFAHATLTLDAAQGVLVAFDALAETRESAQSAAATLTHEMDDATSVEVLAVKLHLLAPPRFRAADRSVVMKFRLSKEELDWSIARMLEEVF